jgi:hypothetical protein
MKQKLLILVICLASFTLSMQQYMFKNLIGSSEKSNLNKAAQIRNDFQLRQKQLRQLRSREAEYKNMLKSKLEAEHQKNIQAYLQPHSGATSVLKDFYSMRY